MARKKKVVIEKILTDYQALDKEKEKPKCYNQKTFYCRAELCGAEWYNTCKEAK